MANLITNKQLRDEHGNTYDNAYIVHDTKLTSKVLESKKVVVTLGIFQSAEMKSLNFQPAIIKEEVTTQTEMPNEEDPENPTIVENTIYRVIKEFVINLTDDEVPLFNAVMMQTKVTEFLQAQFPDAIVTEVL